MMETGEFLDVTIANMDDKDYAWIDIFVYPQFSEGDGSTDAWIKRFDNGCRRRWRCSHVRPGSTPSSASNPVSFFAESPASTNTVTSPVRRSPALPELLDARILKLATTIPK